MVTTKAEAFGNLLLGHEHFLSIAGISGPLCSGSDGPQDTVEELADGDRLTALTGSKCSAHCLVQKISSFERQAGGKKTGGLLGRTILAELEPLQFGTELVGR